MPTALRSPPLPRLLGRAADEADALDPPRESPWTLSGALSFLASAATAFTVSVVGEMPVGELILIAVAGWAVLCLIFNHAPAGRLFQSRYFWVLMVAQVIALGAYIASDLYRHSFPRDMARGWARMVFLAIDVIAVTYLFSCSRKNFLWFVVGQSAGALAYTAIYGPMFGDMWKFGVGAPITFAIFLLAPLGGVLLTALAAAGIGLAHLNLDYRSLGGICFVAAMMVLLLKLPSRARWLIAPFAVALAVLGVFELYQEAKRSSRANRSDIERAAMVTAAKEAVIESPLIGHGSWFSNSNVYDNFMLLRHEAAKQSRVGGFAGANRAPGDEALHSQILVALAEGGLFGGTFFIVFGLGLVWALIDTVLTRHWHRTAPIEILVLLLASWNLLFSPFSGAHRVYIAMACGLVLLQRVRASEARREWEVDA